MEKKGYNIDQLEQLVASDATLTTIVAGFEAFDAAVEKLESLHARYTELTERLYLSTDEDFERLFYNPDSIDILEKKIATLEKIYEMRKAILPLFEKKLSRWEAQGFNVGSLRPVLRKDIETIERKLDAFEKNIVILEEIKQRLEDLSVPPEFMSDFEHMKAILDDPSRLSEIQFELMELEQKISMVSRKKAGYAEQLETWRDEGYNVERLEGVMDQDIEVIEAVFDEFEADLDRIEELRRLLRSIDTTDNEERVAYILSMMRNPDNLYKIEAEIRELAAIEAERQTRKRLSKQVENWKWACLETEPLERVLEDEELPIAAVQEAFEVFDQQYQLLLDLRERIVQIDPTEYEDEIIEIFDKICNVSNIDEIDAQIGRLEQMIEERTRPRAAPGAEEGALHETTYTDEIEELRTLEAQISELDLDRLQEKIHALNTGNGARKAQRD